MKFTVLISKGSEFLIGQIKELPAVITQGESEEEVLENISDALNLYIEGSMGDIVAELSDEPLGDEKIISSHELEVA
jgi:predicted RNase H-like HicB family nuclease